MPEITFTPNIQRHVTCPTAAVVGRTVRDALESIFETNERLRGYILDDAGAVRKHIVIFVDGDPVRDRDQLSDAVREASQIYVMQALSGG